jgi:hypothetical protein
VAELRRAAFDDLMKIGRVGERAQPCHDPGGGHGIGRHGQVESGAELNAANLDASGTESIERLAGTFELHREVAAVEAHPDVLQQRLARLAFRDAQVAGQKRRAGREQPPLEELQGLVGVLDGAVRLGLDVEVDDPAALLAHAYQRAGDLHDVADHGRPRVAAGRGHPWLV